MERRLAAILLTDMVGYSRLMGLDEEGTIARQKAHRQEIIDPKISAYGGRIVKTTGDGLLVEFPSAVDAVKCAIEVQREMIGDDTGVPVEQRIRYRIGINLGDIVIDGDDILGDGVNVAARLEGLAEPGGICVSGTVYDQLKSNIDAGYEFLGEKYVKNISEPIRVFKVLLDPEQAGQTISTKRLVSRPVTIMATAVVLLAALMATWILWWQPWQLIVTPAEPGKMALPLPKRPSIAVLPFRSSAATEKSSLIAAGLSDDIQSALSRLSEMFVIAPDATRKFSKDVPSIKSVAEELGIRYVVQGRVEQQDDRIRVSARLTDALSGREIWSQRFDSKIGDMFSIRDKITLEIVSEIGANISPGQVDLALRRGTNNLDAWLLVRDAIYRNTLLAPEHILPAQKSARKAIELDPKYAQAYAVLGGLLRNQGQNFPGDRPREELFRESERLLRKALELDENLSDVQRRLANLSLARGQHDRAVQFASKATAIDPNSWLNQGVMGWALNHAGRPRDAVAYLKRAMRLNPNHASWVPRELSHSFLLQGDFDEALAWFDRTLKAKPDRFTEMLVRVRAAIILTRRGNATAAQQEIARAKEVFPKVSIDFLHKSRSYKDPTIYQRWDPILIDLGLPKG